MEYQFNIDDGLLRRSIQLLRISLQDTNHDYLSFGKIPTYREKRRNNEVDFVSDEDSKNEDFKGLRKEIALRLRCFHYYVGNADISQANREYHEVHLETDDILEFLQKYIVSYARIYLHDSGTDDQRTLDQGFFESFRQIQADVIDENDQDINDVTEVDAQDIQQVRSAKLCFIRQCGPLQTDFPPEQIDNESVISGIVHNGILKPVNRLLKHRFRGIEVKKHVYRDYMSIPDYCFRVEIGNAHIYVPIELKLSGVYNSFKKRNSYFTDLINQSSYQLLTCKSKLSFVFDKDCIMIIKLPGEGMPELLVEESTQIRLAKMKFSIYLQGVTEADEVYVQSIFDAMKLSDVDKRAVTTGKYNFMRNEWRNQFPHYKLIGDYYIKHHQRKQTNIRIHKGLFRRKLFNFVTTINREDFDDITPIQDNGRDNRKYHANRTFAFSLSMFLNELRCYKKLRKVNSRGSQVERPPSLVGATSTLHYTPYLCESGFIDWPSEIIAENEESTTFSGFFLLMEEISQDFPDTEEEYQRAAAQALQSIHAKGLLHGDVKDRNFRYDASRQRVIFFDFGLSTNTKIKSNALIVSSDIQKVAELNDLRVEVSKAFRNRHIRPIIAHN
ncbi:hypothetical protein DFJ63DRAFT_335194 [Scheffersomyces coipomensis]|uniref:uncharacterized protein n=1 Tax=Scheffersomyces coipomensis TaxID=1788519 RepID=UPI00315D2D4B